MLKPLRNTIRFLVLVLVGLLARMAYYRYFLTSAKLESTSPDINNEAGRMPASQDPSIEEIVCALLVFHV